MDYSWPDMWDLALFQILRRPTPSTRPSEPGLRRVSPPTLTWFTSALAPSLWNLRFGDSVIARDGSQQRQRAGSSTGLLRSEAFAPGL